MVLKRERYISKVKPYINKSLIKVFTGQRRAGKSYLMLQVIDLLKEEGVNEVNIIRINKEDNDFDHINDYNDLLKYVELVSRGVDGKKYIFIDEIQEIKEFEKAIRSLILNEEYDVYITGSNAGILSSDLASFLSGRFIEIQVFPLNFDEFLYFHNLKLDSDSFLKYIKLGGLPYLTNLELTEEIAYGYLSSVYNTILFKDIVRRFNVRNVQVLEYLINYLAENIGEPLSANKISEQLKKSKIAIAPKVIITYLEYLRESFFIFDTKRIDIKTSKIFENGTKYYFGDIGLKNIVNKYDPKDVKGVLENIVFLDLRSKGYKVFTGIIEDINVDFTAISADGTRMYIQISNQIGDKEKLVSICEPLFKIKDNYEKIVLTQDETFVGDNEGVKVLNILKFLAS